MSRTVRIIRLIRIIKLYKVYIQKRHRQGARSKTRASTTSLLPGAGIEDEEGTAEVADSLHDPESRVGKKLSELTTRKLIVIVLAMLFITPYFKATEHRVEMASSTQYGADDVMRAWRFYWQTKNSTAAKQLEETLLLYLYYQNPHATGDDERVGNKGKYRSSLMWLGFFTRQEDAVGAVLVQNETDVTVWDEIFNNPSSRYVTGNMAPLVLERLSSPLRADNTCTFFDCSTGWLGHSVVESSCPNEDLRSNEFEVVIPLMFHDDPTVPRFIFAFDRRPMSEVAAILSMLQTIFLCIVLSTANTMFTHDANRLVLSPIDRMVTILQQIKDDPLKATQLGFHEYRREQQAKRARKEKESKPPAKLTQVYRAISWLWTEEKQLEPMETVILEKTFIKLGTLLDLGFGEAGTRIISKNLQGAGSGIDPMLPGEYVEAIFGFCDIRSFTTATEVLQGNIMLFVNEVGAIVHRVVAEHCGATNKNVGDAFLSVWRLTGRPKKDHTRLADCSLLSFAKIVAQLNTNSQLAEYRNHPALLGRVKNFRVKLGFGLHSGWAIEGAIGSELKIDASYLSCNVNTAEHLEAATKHYGVSIMCSDAFVELLAEEFQDEMRLLDNIMLYDKPTKVYTLDLAYMSLPVDESSEHETRNRFKRQGNIRLAVAEKWSESWDAVEVFKSDKQLVLMRERFPQKFFDLFGMGVHNYVAGEWDVAREYLETTVGMLPPETEDAQQAVDGPSKALLDFMQKSQFKAGDKWEGWRTL
mmetsp:Transcript_41355/g.108678  ORF Transcript_41355/g.108678 Transcript_41355/m.108678 type:complete len:756 (+) Transcript_41355:447-2714(+)